MDSKSGVELLTGLLNAQAVSSDGSRIGGDDDVSSRPAIWTAGVGTQIIPGLTDNFSRHLVGISGDGQVGVGSATGSRASFRWDGFLG
jgi:hypothetical protein